MIILIIRDLAWKGKSCPVVDVRLATSAAIVIPIWILTLKFFSVFSGPSCLIVWDVGALLLPTFAAACGMLSRSSGALAVCISMRANAPGFFYLTIDNKEFHN
jgi:hypothetical protein